MSPKWASHGEKDEPGFIPALQEKLTAAAARTPSTARRVSRVVGWGHGQGFRVDTRTNWHTTSNTIFLSWKQRDYDLDDHWISLAATFLDHLEDCIHSHHLSSTMRPMDFGRVNCIERQRFWNFPLRLGIPRETRVHLPCPREMLRPPVQGGSASNPNMYPLVVKPGDRKSCFYSWLSYWNIGFSRPGYAIGGCTCQKLDYRWS